MFSALQRHTRNQKNWSGNIMRSCGRGKIRQSRRKSSHQNRRKRQTYGKSYTVTSRKADSNQNSQQRRNLWTENDEKGEQKMKKTIFEEMGGTYVRCGDYFIPNLILPEEEERRVVGVWGQRHLQYLKEL